MKNKVFLVMLLSIAALSAGCNTVAGAGRIYSAAEKRSRTPPKVGCLASVRSGGAGPRPGCPGMPDAAIAGRLPDGAPP